LNRRDNWPNLTGEQPGSQVSYEALVIQMLFEAGQERPNTVKSFHIENGKLTLVLNTKIGDLTMIFVERDFNYRLSDVTLTDGEAFTPETEN
jgi:hypothetical protein